jgi:hypothetical protein
MNFSSKPFTEKDFNRKSNKIFDKDFIDHILKVKSKTLFSDGEFVTPEIRKGDESIKLYCDYHSKEKEMTLMLHFTYLIDNDQEEITTESATIYRFKLINNKLKFTGVQMAG